MFLARTAAQRLDEAASSYLVLGEAISLAELRDEQPAEIVTLDEAVQGFTRRRFLDRGLVSTIPAYLGTLAEYNRVLKQITEAMQSKPLFIADGHHRYETALL